MNSYLTQLEARHEAPFFFKHFYFTELLPKEQGSMLSYLIAIENYCKVRLKDDPTFFECNIEGFINKKLKGWSVTEIKSAITNLVNSGYVYKRVIDNNKTFLALNYPQIDKLYDKWVTQEQEGDEQYIICQ